MSTTPWLTVGANGVRPTGTPESMVYGVNDPGSPYYGWVKNPANGFWYAPDEPVGGPAQQGPVPTEAEIRARFLAGEITSAQARAAFAALGWDQARIESAMSSMPFQQPSAQSPLTQFAGGGNQNQPLNQGVPNPLDQQTLRDIAFGNQTQQGAFTRFLSGMQGATPWAAPAREAVLTRGALLGNLAPLLGYGPGNEQSNFDFFQQRFNQGAPSQADLNARLRALTAASSTNPADLSQEQVGILAPFLNASGEFSQQRALDAQIAARQARVNPEVRGGYGGLLRRLFEEQQATTPETPWLNFAQSRGFF